MNQFKENISQYYEDLSRQHEQAENEIKIQQKVQASRNPKDLLVTSDSNKTENSQISLNVRSAVKKVSIAKKIKKKQV